MPLRHCLAFYFHCGSPQRRGENESSVKEEKKKKKRDVGERRPLARKEGGMLEFLALKELEERSKAEGLDPFFVLSTLVLISLGDWEAAKELPPELVEYAEAIPLRMLERAAMKYYYY